VYLVLVSLPPTHALAHAPSRAKPQGPGRALGVQATAHPRNASVSFAQCCARHVLSTEAPPRKASPTKPRPLLWGGGGPLEGTHAGGEMGSHGPPQGGADFFRICLRDVLLVFMAMGIRRIGSIAAMLSRLATACRR